MKKSILVVLLAVLAIIVWTVLVTAKATDKEKLQQPTEIQKAEPGAGAFPEVVLPKQHVARPTYEDFKKEVLDAKGWTPEKVEAMKNAPSVRAEDETISEKELTYCRMSGNLTALYYRPAGIPYLACWGQIGIATLINMDYNPLFGVCPYPLYPFQPAVVRLRQFQPAPCTLYCEARIYGVDYSGGAYPSGELCTSDQANPIVFYHAGGTLNIDVNLLNPTSCCVYDAFFAVFVIDNTDDFIDPDYCPDSPYLPGSFLYDITALTNNSFWNPYGLGGSWYDVVTYGMASGPVYIQVFGYTAPENTCPPPVDPWYFKPPYPPLAPFGVPDFNQYQMPGPAFDGPTAEANSYWYFVAQGILPTNPPDVTTLINEIAAASQTDPVTGTECDKLEAGILNVIKSYGGWWFTEETVYGPDFWYLQKELKACHDVVLLLGFWQEDPLGSGTWVRFGGHFVTLAGVDIFNYAFAFSDPARDNAELFAGPGQVCGVHNPANDPIDHNGGQTSYDFYYAAWPSASPGGLIWLPDYIADWTMFQGQNFRPEHQPYSGPYLSGNPVHVEIEQSIKVSPGPKEMYGEVDGSSSAELNNNHGGIEGFYVDFGAGFQSGLYYGTFIAGTSQADLSCDYGDYFPTMSFDPLGPPVLDSFVVTGSAGDYTVYQLTNHFAHKYIAGLMLTEYAFGVWVPTDGTENCEYAIEDVFVLQNTSATDIIGLETGMWCDFDVSSGGTGDLTGYDQQHQSVWMYDSSVPTANFGFTKKPQIVGDVPITGYALSQTDRVYDGQYIDSMKYWMDNLGWGMDNPTTPEDKSIFIADAPFDLLAGGIRVEKWLKWGYPSTIQPGRDESWRCFLYNVLHQEGYYRGDVNKDGALDEADSAYLLNYLFKGGPKPIEFEDQADVNNDGKLDVTDAVYFFQYYENLGPAPIDYNRFLMRSPFVDPAHKVLGKRTPGLFGDANWRYLHPLVARDSVHLKGKLNNFDLTNSTLVNVNDLHLQMRGINCAHIIGYYNGWGCPPTCTDVPGGVFIIWQNQTCPIPPGVEKHFGVRLKERAPKPKIEYLHWSVNEQVFDLMPFSNQRTNNENIFGLIPFLNQSWEETTQGRIKVIVWRPENNLLKTSSSSPVYIQRKYAHSPVVIPLDSLNPGNSIVESLSWIPLDNTSIPLYPGDSLFFEVQTYHGAIAIILRYTVLDSLMASISEYINEVRISSFPLEFICGDANGDDVVSVSDVIYIINYLFKGGLAPIPLESADVNCDGKVTVSDVVYLINYLFKGGPKPCRSC